MAIGGSGLSTTMGTGDIVVIANGGDDFSARMKQYTDAKASAEAAIADAGIVGSVKDALADALDKQSRANQAIKDAQDAAAKIIADANASSSDTRAKAGAYYDSKAADANALLADATSQKAAADAYAADARSKADVLAKALDDMNKSIAQKQADVDAEMAKAVQLQQDAADSKAKYDALVAKLQGVLNG
jgi:chromosome segregation ATPase